MLETWTRVKKYKFCYLWIMPFFVIFAVFTVYPMLNGFLISLTNYDGLGALENAKYVGAGNYIKLFQDEKFWLSLKNTFVLWLYIVPARTLLALILAMILNSSKILGKKIYSVIVLLPYVTAVAVVAIIFRVLLATEGGIINSFLNVKIGWLDTTQLSKVSVALMNIWRMVGYFSLVLLAGMQKIPNNIHEAASIDGANKITIFRKIVMPLMIPEIFFVMLMSTIWIFQNVGDVMVLTKGGPLNSSTNLVYYIYQSAYEFSKMGYASAMTYILFLLLAAVSAFVVKAYYSRMEEA